MAPSRFLSQPIRFLSAQPLTNQRRAFDLLCRAERTEQYEWLWMAVRCLPRRESEREGGGGESSRGGKQKASETKTNGSRLPARRPQWKRYSVSAETDLFMPLCCVRRAEPDINCLCLCVGGGGGDVEFHTRKHTVQKETWGTETVPLVCQSSPQENENFILFLAESFTPD